MKSSSHRRGPWILWVSGRVYRHLLRVYPPRFRRRFGDDLVRTFAETCRRAWNEGGHRAVAKAWWRALPDLILEGAGERLDAVRGRPLDAAARLRSGEDSLPDGRPGPTRGPGPERESLPGRGSRPRRPPRPGPRPETEIMDTLWLDLRYAFRTLRRSPVFTAVAAATLALGVGATTAVFSVVDGILLRPLPYPEPGELVVLWETEVGGGETFTRGAISPANFIDWRERAGAFAALAAVDGWNPTLSGGAGAQELPGARVSAGYFEALGVEPALGRVLRPDEEGHPGAARVAVLGHATWQRDLGGDPAAIGRTIRLDDQPYTVVGVMPAGFRPPLAPERQVWAPLDVDPANRGGKYLRILGRLAPGTSVESARAEMDAVALRLGEAHPDSNAGLTAAVVPLHREVVGDVSDELWTLLGAVAFVLLIATANLANLQLARASARGGELALRSALGAGRGRLALQTVTESLTLAALGGLAGVVLALWGIRALVALAPGDIPRLDAVTLDLRVLAFAVGATVGTGLLVSLLAMTRASGRDLAGRIADRARSGERRRGPGLRRALVVAQVAVALVLLVGAGLLIRSFAGLLSEDPGFDPEVMAARVRVGDDHASPEAAARFFTALLERLEAHPGTRSAGGVFLAPFAGGAVTSTFDVAGRPDEEPAVTRVSPVTPRFFDSLSIALTDGRGFTAADGPQAPPVAILNRTAARSFFPDQDPVGQRVDLHVSLVEGGNPEREIVGVVADARFGGLHREPEPQIFIPHAQHPTRSLWLAVATVGEPLDFAPQVRDEVAALDPDVVVSRISTYAGLIGGSVSEERFYMLLLGLFATIALALGAVGLYGVLAYAVARRRREMGVRLALGARPVDVVRMVVREGLGLAAVGVLVGLVAASALARFLAGMLYRVEASDPLTVGTTTVLLLGVAGLASLIPARRAGRTDPMRTLRES